MNYWPYQKLIVWQKAMDLTQETYRLVKFLPAEERYALSDQMRRAAVSVPSNIAEGHGRHTEKEFKQFLSIAKGSVFELEPQFFDLHKNADTDTGANRKSTVVMR